MGATGGDPAAPHEPGFREAFLFWLKLGFINFGGPAGQIAIMHRELVERRRWISEEHFLHALNYCMLLPGPEAQQLATYVGWLLHRSWGGIVAGVLFVLPGLAVLLGLSYAYVTYGHVPEVAGVLLGLKAVVLAIVAHAVLRIGGKALRTPAMVALAAAAFVAIGLLGVPFPLIVAGAALVGYVGYRIAPRHFRPASHHGAGAAAHATLHGVDDAPPAHALPDARRAWRTAAVGALLWAAPLALLFLMPGPGGVFRQNALFFTQVALVTFGGAYAVLSYISTEAVVFGWLQPAQMVDGLGLAESTPGPLIMVVTFVGFLSGYHLHGPVDPVLAGVMAGIVATYFTFLPSFLFIFLGAPYVERLRGKVGLSAALGGVTAAVVGVILNLAVFFGRHVLVTPGGVAWFPLALAAVAFLALWRFKVEVVPVIVAGALAGLAYTLATGAA